MRKKIMFWVPYEHKRRRGRPAISWKDEIIRNMGYLGAGWRRIVKYGAK